jgi:hypothetical protein
MLTKQAEKELYSDILAKCPTGYVRDILADMRLDVERAITSDFGFIPFADYMAQAEKDRAEIQEARLQLSKLRDDIRTMESRKSAIEHELDKVRAIASKLQWLGAL